ncbi:MAG: CvpA family protein [Candidatus Omnitrophota bacterium]
MPAVLNEINWVDICFIIIASGMVYKGLRRGISSQIIPLIAGLAVIFLSLTYYKMVSEAFFGFMLQKWSKPFSLLLISMTIMAAAKLLEKLVNLALPEDASGIERIAGALIATFRAAMLFGMIGIFLLLVPVSSANNSAAGESRLCKRFIQLDVQLYRFMSEIFVFPENAKDISVDEKLSFTKFLTAQESLEQNET